MKKPLPFVIAGVAALALAGAAVFLLRQNVPPAQPEPASAPPVAQPAAAAPAASEPAVKYPIAAASAASSAAQALDLDGALGELFGRKAVLSLFQLEDFTRRFVATVDNLGRSQASPKLWPLNPTAGRFVAQTQAGAETIGPDNGLRYTPYVVLLESVDLPQAVAVYTRFFPQFQDAYRELGYPNGYFNDRLVEVIDQLLAAPVPGEVIKVHLPPSNGLAPPPRPWVLYEFDDPALQALTAGQKLLVRMGSVNERRVKARLTELRRLLTASSALPK